MPHNIASLFGEPNTGVHAYRDPIANLAVVDLVLTLILSIIISKFYPDYQLVFIFMCLIMLSILVHYIVGVRTQLLVYLGLLFNSIFV